MPKSYRIISLLNCLSKIAEKMMANRISFWSEATESLNLKALLDFEQMGGRKNHSAVNAVMNLTHDIQLARVNNNTVSCVLLNIKEAFDHVSLAQLVKILKKLKMSKTAIKWTISFMQKRRLSLIFDDNQLDFQEIESGIP